MAKPPARIPPPAYAHPFLWFAAGVYLGVQSLFLGMDAAALIAHLALVLGVLGLAEGTLPPTSPTGRA